MVSIRYELESVTRHLVENLGESSETLFQGQIGRAQTAGIGDAAISVGSKAPGFRLPDAKGDRVGLAELLSHGSIVLVFYRGGWCPYCNIQLRALQKALGDIRACGSDLVAISPSTPDNSLETQERESLEYPVLSDHDCRVARSYGLVYTVSPEARRILSDASKDIDSHNGTTSGELPAPATYVVDSSAVIRFCEINVDYRTRTEPRTVLEVLRKLQKDKPC